MAGEVILPETLDGGRVIAEGPALTVGADGLLSFTFQAGEIVGHSRLLLYRGETTQTLQFWVVDRANPRNNPASE